MYYIKCFNSENLEMRINRSAQKCAYRGLMTSVKLVIIHFYLNTLLRDCTQNPKIIMGMWGLKGRKVKTELLFPPKAWN